MLRAIFAYAFITVYVLVCAPFALLWSALTKDTRSYYVLGRFCLRVVGVACGIRVVIRGREKITSDRNYLFLSNHQGNCDAPVIFHAVPRDLRALIKKEIMKLPVLSLVLRSAGFVPIDRSNPARAKASIEAGVERIRRGLPFFAFPEGTRSRDGRLGEFKKGAFVMAIQSEVPIMPLTIRNSCRIQAPGEFSLHPGTIEVLVHDPIPTEGMAFEDRDRLMRLTREAIESGL